MLLDHLAKHLEESNQLQRAEAYRQEAQSARARTQSVRQAAMESEGRARHLKVDLPQNRAAPDPAP